MTPTPLTGNLDLLRQAVALLDRLDDATYAADHLGRSSVGAQLRHVLDHYRVFLDGLPHGAVDYDARSRDPVLEQETAAADRHAEGVLQALSALNPAAMAAPLRVHSSTSGHGADAGYHPSSVGRELLFLVSHTVHHFAIIRLLLEAQGVDCPADFGVAPSTLAHRATAG